MSPCLPSWYNSPDLSQTWRMSVLSLYFRNSHIPASQWWSTGAGFLSDLIKFGLRAKYGHGCILGPVWSCPGHDGEWGHSMFASARIIIAQGPALGNFTIYHREQCSVFAKLSSNISTRIVRFEYIISRMRLSGTEHSDEIEDWFLSLLSNLLKITRISLTQCHL